MTASTTGGSVPAAGHSRALSVAVLVFAALLLALLHGHSRELRKVHLHVQVLATRSEAGIASAAWRAEAAVTGDRPASLSAWETAAWMNLTAWRAQLMRQVRDSEEMGAVFKGEKHWSLFAPVISCPRDTPLKRYGRGDGSKLLCDRFSRRHAAPRNGSGCVIYSLGSNGDYQFEQEMLKATNCEIHTFDCTYDGASQQPGRHVYHKQCVGSSGGATYTPWPRLTAELGHRAIELLKIDIEGFEYSVLADLLPATPTLPHVISIELHAGFAAAPSTPAGMALVFLHLANLGYAPLAMEPNPIAVECCAEFTFMRVAVPSQRPLAAMAPLRRGAR